MKPIQLKIGADPELFVMNSKGVIVPAHDMIPGTKENPFPVNGGAVQVDGIAVEYNVNPSVSALEFCTYNDAVKRQLKRMLPKGHRLVAIPEHTFPKEIWDGVPEEAKRLGCDPDRNAWTGKINVIEEPPEGYRTAAGHIHVGWTEDADPNDPDHLEACEMLAKQLDLTVGLLSLLFEKPNKRRSLYGKAGDFRAKSYGMEYRTLSNFWVQDKILTSMVFKETISAFRMLEMYGEVRSKFGNVGDFRGCIDNVKTDTWAFSLTREPEPHYKRVLQTVVARNREYGDYVR